MLERLQRHDNSIASSVKNIKNVKFVKALGGQHDLNPVELLNLDVKANAVGLRWPRTLSELIDEVRSYLHGLQQQPHIIKRFFTHPATYAA